MVNSITELYSFMDSSNNTLDLKVLGEGSEEEELHAEEDSEEAGACRCALQQCNEDAGPRATKRAGQPGSCAAHDRRNPH